MNLRECKRLKPGAMVRAAYETASEGGSLGMVLHKEYVEEEHRAKCLGGKKQKRYDLYVHWLRASPYRMNKANPSKVQCWEVMLLKNE